MIEKTLNNRAVTFISNTFSVTQSYWIAGLSLLLLMSLTETPAFLFKDLNNDALFQENRLYLEKTEERLLINLSELSVAKGTLDAITSTDFGFEFIVNVKVQVGSEINALKEVITDATSGTEYLMLAIATVGLVHIMTHSASLVFLNALLIIGIIHNLLLLTAVERLKTLSKTSLKIVFFLFVSTQIVIPYSLHLSSYCSYQLYTHHSKEQWTNLRYLHSEITPDSTAKTSEEHAKSLLKKFELLSVQREKLVSSFHSNWYKYFVAELFIVLIMPILFLIISLWIHLAFIRLFA